MNRATGGVTDDGYAQVFWTAFRRSANAMFVAGLDRRIVAVNEAGTALAGRSADQLTRARMSTVGDDPPEAPDVEVWRAIGYSAGTKAWSAASTGAATRDLLPRQM